MQYGEDDITREIRLKAESQKLRNRDKELTKPLISRIEELEKENLKMKHEIVWVLNEVWPLVHSLTSRDCVKKRFLKMADFCGRKKNV